MAVLVDMWLVLGHVTGIVGHGDGFDDLMISRCMPGDYLTYKETSEVYESF